MVTSCASLFGIALGLTFTASPGAAPEIGPPDPSLLRYELGRRVRAFETVFEGRSDAASRRVALPHLQEAVQCFFSLRFTEAASTLDAARRKLEGGESTPSRLWADALSCAPERRLLDPAAAQLRLRVRALYVPAAARPDGAVVLFRLRDDDAAAGGKAGVAVAELPLAALPAEATLDLSGLTEGDRLLHVELRVGDDIVPVGHVGVSLARDVARRLSALEEGLDAWTADRRADRAGFDGAKGGDQARAESSEADGAPVAGIATAAETVRGLRYLLARLADDSVPETDYPATRLLVEAEQALEALRQGRAFYGMARPGEFWLHLKSRGPVIPARVLVPAPAPAGGALPLVIALHGMGGSENLFFDGYGNGSIVRLCKHRGWLLAAPRSGLLSGVPVLELVESLAEILPVDRSKVFLVGHSMGAQQALAAADSAPQRFAAVAALGGGWRAERPAALARLPLFLGVGSDDFALRGVRRLDESLRAAGAPARVFRIYPDVEHLAVVQVALPDVFAFYDEVLAKGSPP